MLAIVLAALLAAQAARPFPDERLLLDRQLETLRRILPDGPTASADVLLVRDLAEAARLSRVEVQPRAPVESGTRGEVVLDLTALGGYEEIDRFFQKLAVSPRLADVEGLTLTGVQIVRRVAAQASINPRLLLSLLEHESGWVYGQPKQPDRVRYPLGWHISGRQGLYQELSITATQLSKGY